jgi:hypothetical protein
MVSPAVTPPDMSNFYCLPGGAGGTPMLLVIETAAMARYSIAAYAILALSRCERCSRRPKRIRFRSGG